MNIGELLEKKAQKNRRKIFLLSNDKRISYAEMNENTNRVANGLVQLGARRGTKVALMLPNCPEWLYAWFGLVKVGAVMVPVNLALKGAGLEYVLRHSRSGAIVIDQRLLGVYRKVQDRLRNVKQIIVYSCEATSRADIPPDAISYDHLLKYTSDPPTTAMKDTQVMSIMYTSGTTGTSKGCMRPRIFPCYLGQLAVHIMKYTREDILYTCLPLFHGNAQDMSVMAALIADASLALDDGFSARQFWQRILNYKATAFNLIGVMATILSKQPSGQFDRAHRAKRCFVAGMPRNIWVDFEKRFGVKIIEGYGMVENGIVISNSCDDSRVGSIGKPTEIAESRIVDDEDKELDCNQTGEILTRPRKPYSMMLGYWRMPAETLKCCRDLWFHTGDYGYKDEDGYFYFVDRKKDAIRRRGENISSLEIERIVNEHPKVLESAAIPIPSGLGEDEVKLCVVAKAKEELSPWDIIHWCEERMAYFMVPRYFEQKERFPKTSTQRIQKNDLRAEGITSRTWDREKVGYKLKKPLQD